MLHQLNSLYPVRYTAFALCVFGLLLSLFALVAFHVGLPVVLVFAALVAVGVYDLQQSRHAILRNYPVIGHIRFMLEYVRPEVRQYFIESDSEAAPFSRAQRSLVYQRAKGDPDNRPFGTHLDVGAHGYEWVNHSLAPTQLPSHDFRVWIGGNPDAPSQSVAPCTQPYHASLSPGDSTLKLLAINAMAMAGLSGMKNDMVTLLSNRHLALEKYQSEVLLNSALAKQDTPIDQALRQIDKDASYPEWHDLYLRNVVSAQAASYGNRIAQTLVDSMPPGFVSDPNYDFGANEERVTLVKELVNVPTEAKLRLDALVAELLANFGAHSRNAVRGILKASNR